MMATGIRVCSPKTIHKKSKDGSLPRCSFLILMVSHYFQLSIEAVNVGNVTRAPPSSVQYLLVISVTKKMKWKDTSCHFEKKNRIYVIFILIYTKMSLLWSGQFRFSVLWDSEIHLLPLLALMTEFSRSSFNTHSQTDSCHSSIFLNFFSSV